MCCPLHPIQPHAEFDPNLTKPVRFTAPPAGLHPAERQRLENERTCLIRERDTIQRAIEHIADQLLAA